MSTPDGGDLWVIGTGITLIALFATVLGGVVARDRALQRQLRESDDKAQDGDNKLHDRLSRVREEFSRELSKLRNDFSEYQLLAQREYASVDHLKEVETRLAQAIERLDSRLEAMPGQLAQELKQVFKPSD